MKVQTKLACPVCSGPLLKTEKTYSCTLGHSYDIASEGYVYLLPPNKKHSRDPGDCREMVAARRRFLEAGYYRLFSEKLNQLVLEHLQTEHPAVLDAGCGEGYYTGRLHRALTEGGGAPEVIGFDISKAAVKAAAKRNQEILFAVASSFQIPVINGGMDCVVNVFAPIVPGELNRVLKPGGILLLAIPGERHLYGLKEILYDEPYENEHRKTEYPGFHFLGRTSVLGEITVEGAQAVRDLFAMTPYFWKTPKEGSKRLEHTGRLRTPIQFEFLIYRKVGEA